MNSNIEKMVTALSAVKQCIELNSVCEVRMDGSHNIVNYRKKVDEALNVKLRNCDRFDTDEEAWEAYVKEVGKDKAFQEDYPTWLFASYLQ